MWSVTFQDFLKKFYIHFVLIPKSKQVCLWCCTFVREGHRLQVFGYKSPLFCVHMLCNNCSAHCFVSLWHMVSYAILIPYLHAHRSHLFIAEYLIFLTFHKNLLYCHQFMNHPSASNHAFSNQHSSRPTLLWHNLFSEIMPFTFWTSPSWNHCMPPTVIQVKCVSSV